jgi:hypothetical protein
VTQHPTDAILQWVMVIMILAAAVYLAIVNNQADIVFNLASLAFGYYFGGRTQMPSVKK